MAEQDGDPLGPADVARSSRDLAALLRAGLVVEESGRLHVRDAFTPLLAAQPASVASGPERFLVKGRLVTWPRRQSDRLELLAFVAERTVGEGEELTEREFTERLAAISDDPAAVRRYLVDAGVVVRDPDGSRYRRP